MLQQGKFLSDQEIKNLHSESDQALEPISNQTF